MKPRALAKLKDIKILQVLCACLEFDPTKRPSAHQLLHHPFLERDTANDALFPKIRTREETSEILDEIGGTPEGWGSYLKRMLTPYVSRSFCYSAYIYIYSENSVI